MLRNRIFLLILYLFFNVHLKTAYSKISDKIIREPDEVNRYRYTIDNRNSRNYDAIKLITKALEIIKQEKLGITAAKINKCLSIYFGNAKKKFNCIKKLIYKGRIENIDSKPYFYLNVINNGRLPNENKQKFDNQFKDLTKSGKENEAKRGFQTILNFSQDYLDVDDLLRTDTEITETPVQIRNINNKIHIISYLLPMKNAANDLQFRDFSQDYLDTNDLLRTNTKMGQESPKQVKNTQYNKLIPSKNEVDFAQDMNDYTKKNVKKRKGIKNIKKIYVFKLIPNKNEQKKLRRFGNIGPKDDFIKKKILRMNSVESDSSSSSDESKSEEEKVKSKNVKVEDKKPKRFQVIDKSVADISSEEADNNSNESDIPIQRPIEIPKNKKGVYYMQAPSRIFKIRNEGRRRLPHFLPKRYHWDEDDMRNLQYQWFTGRQGKYWGHYKTPY